MTLNIINKILRAPFQAFTDLCDKQLPWTLLAWCLLCLLVSKQSHQHMISLNGAGWIVSNSNKSIVVPAHVPGGIYTDLKRNNVLGQDIFYGKNDLNYRWVGYENWTYTLSFITSNQVPDSRYVNLVAHGLDTISTISLNGQIVGTTNNMFVRYKFDIKPFLRISGIRNVLEINFSSPIKYAKSKAHQSIVRNRGKIIPPYCPTPAQRGECHINFIRKMQASFSWDWGPAFPSVGIYRPIFIEFGNFGIIRDMLVETNPTVPIRPPAFDTPPMRPRSPSISSRPASPFLANNPTEYNQWFRDSPQNIRIQLSNKTSAWNTALDNNWSLKVTLVVEMPVPCVSYSMHVEFDLDSKLHYESDQIVNHIRTIEAPEMSEKSVRIGFRTIELIQEPVKQDDKQDPSEGLSFYFRVNGVNIFAMGSNWIPSHILPELSADPDHVRYLLASAKEANMNMLRVWGGGLYESDMFYQIADEMGLLIWQDLMFACALYPADDEFLTSVAVEVEQQIQRLQHHPSIALWAGNNENEMAIAGVWWVEVSLYSKMLRPDYARLYGQVIMPRVQTLDSTRAFLMSSPSNGIMSENQENFIARAPNGNKFGDIHHYDYFSDSFDWTSYPSPRFASEYGFQSYPSFSALAQVTNATDWRYPLTANILHRQHRLTGDAEIYGQISAHFPAPGNGGVEKFKSYIYLTQLTQAIGIKTQTEFYRRNRAVDSQGLGNTMGALYWQLNDVWQAPSWSSIEFGGKWKMLHYFARRFFFPIHIVPFLVQTGSSMQQFTHQLFSSGGQLNSPGPSEKLVIDCIRDDMFDRLYEFNITIRLYRWFSFSPIWRDRIFVDQSRPQNVSRVYEQDMSKILSQAGLTSSSGGVFQVVIEQQPRFGLSEVENYLLPVAPVKITGMRVPSILVETIHGPFDMNGEGKILSSNHVSEPVSVFESSQTPGLWSHMFRITLRSDVIAMFVWLDLNLINSTYLVEQAHLDAKHNYKVHPMPVKFRFSDNAFNMFEPQRAVDLYLDRPLSLDQLHEVLEVRSMANSFNSA
ncbi:Beta-mannosidase, partial [Fragariocoptes setiger]